ncbi:MAG: hypothetical protein MUO52_13670, partial [Desulfobacterales bacterium]|nr:hypothetical protein [Desulfobacterales bacterium]
SANAGTGRTISAKMTTKTLINIETLFIIGSSHRKNRGMSMAARIMIPAIIIAAIINQWGTKRTGLGFPEIFSSSLLKNVLLLESILINETNKGIPKNTPKAAKRKAPLSPTLNPRKAT